MDYKQEIQARQKEAKDLLKQLKKQRTKAKKEEKGDSYIRKLNFRIKETELLIVQLNPTKYELYKLSTGAIVNLKILKSFLRKLKGNSWTVLQETEEGLVLGYSTNGQYFNGKLEFFAVDPELVATSNSIPDFNMEEWQ